MKCAGSMIVFRLFFLKLRLAVGAFFSSAQPTKEYCHERGQDEQLCGMRLGDKADGTVFPQEDPDKHQSPEDQKISSRAVYNLSFIRVPSLRNALP